MNQIVLTRPPVKTQTPERVAFDSSGGHFYPSTSPQPLFEFLSFAKWSPAAHAVWSSYYAFDGSTIATAQDWQRFRLLRDNWRKERGITSSVAKMAMSPSYQRIIGMGGVVVPMILRELESEADDPDHWFWALEMITGADPVPVEAYGDTVRMAQAWLSWAKGQYDW